MLRRWTNLVLWTAVACLIAGAYGALHNQMSYTVSSEYFHRFKFIQFRVHDAWQNRWGAAVVGWRAAWWTGLLFGPPMVIVALRRSPSASLPRIMAAAFLIAVVVDAMCALGALGASSILIDDESFPDLWIPNGVQNHAAFKCAGVMHEASYLGGLLATLIACWAIVRMSRPPVLKID